MGDPDGHGGLLAKGKAGFLDFPPIFSHFLPFRVNGVDSRPRIREGQALRRNDGVGAG